MRFELTIESGNQAMVDAPAYEVGVILSYVEYRVVHAGDTSGRVMDTNGNPVGSWKLEAAGDE